MIPPTCDTADVRKAIEANYAKIDAATVKNEVLMTFIFMVPGGEHIHEAGKMPPLPLGSRPERHGAHANFLQHPTPKLCKTVIQIFSLKGSETRGTISRPIEDVLTTHDHRTHRLFLDGKVEDVWKNKGSRWLLKRRKELMPTATMDGKPLKPSNP